MDYCFPLPYEHSRFLFYSSFLIGLASFVSLYYQDTVTFLFMFIMFISSIHFWYKPDHGLVKEIDMFLCKLLSLYFFWITFYFYDEYCQVVYFNVLYSIFFFYACEIVLYACKNKKWIVFHMVIHFYFAMFAPFILYIL